jgi:hypothetical protein
MLPDNQFYFELRRKIQEFENLDSRLFEKLDDLEYLGAVINAKKEIKRLLSGKEVIHVGPDKTLSDKLQKIRDDYGYNIDYFISKASEAIGEDISQSSEETKDYVDALFSEGTADYVDENFFRRRNEVGAILVSQTVPDVVLYHLSKLKECYSLGLYEATFIYCRAVVESGLYVSFKKKVKRGPKERDFEEWNFKSLLESMKKFLKKSSYKQANYIREKTNDILHHKHDKVIISESEALEAVKITFRIMEEIFL